MNTAQKQTLIVELRKLGPKVHSQPAFLNHSCLRLDSDAAIFEAEFSRDKISVEAMKRYLANIFGVDPSTITHTSQGTKYGPLVTFTRGVERLRMILFGGVGTGWSKSQLSALAYLKDNHIQWDGV